MISIKHFVNFVKHQHFDERFHFHEFPFNFCREILWYCKKQRLSRRAKRPLHKNIGLATTPSDHVLEKGESFLNVFNRLLCLTLKKFAFTTMYVQKIHGPMCSPGSVHSCCSVILFRSFFSLVNSWKDDAGRFIMAEFSFHNISFRIACL